MKSAEIRTAIEKLNEQYDVIQSLYSAPGANYEALAASEDAISDASLVLSKILNEIECDENEYIISLNER